jgi:TolB-like protein/Tfp pilus assembly protein PilF
MSEIFISYARSTEDRARKIGEALRGLGYAVWRDDELPAHRDYSEVIEERLRAAKAVVVVWSAEAVRSQWVRAEADVAREAGTLVQLSVDGAAPPMPFNRIQCADMSGWTGDPEAPGWRKVAASVAELVGDDGHEPRVITQPAPSAAPAAPALPARPSIAVLPFADPGGAAEADYFADGMVDEIVTALTRFPSLFVIASASSLSYGERERDFRRIGRELGVRYLLEGSVRRSGKQVRIAADLVEAEAGARIWSERFEGALDDVFALQDEVANAVAAHIEPTIQAADLRRGDARPTEDLGAYDLYLRGWQRWREFNRASFMAAIAFLEQAVARDPTFAEAWALLAHLYARALGLGWAADREDTQQKAHDAIRHAMLGRDDDAVILAEVAFAKAILGGDRTSLLAMSDRALTLNRGSFTCWVLAGHISLLCSQYEQAAERLRYALRLNPRAPDRNQALTGVGAALVMLGRFEEAIPSLNEAITARPDYPMPRFFLAIALSHLGRIDEAKGALAEFETLASLQSLLDTVIVPAGWSEVVFPALGRLGVDI